MDFRSGHPTPSPLRLVGAYAGARPAWGIANTFFYSRTQESKGNFNATRAGKPLDQSLEATGDKGLYAPFAEMRLTPWRLGCLSSSIGRAADL